MKFFFQAFLCALLSILSTLFLTAPAYSQGPSLGAASDFVLFTTNGAVGNTGVSIISGKIGTNNGAITNFTPVPGQQDSGNSVTLQAAADLSTAYTSLKNATPTFPNHAAVLGNGETLTAGVHRIQEAASINGTLILDAQGVSNAVFIIQIYGAFSPGPSSIISLTGGALACNVFFAVEGGAIAIATTSDMKGNFIANPGAVSIAASGILEGRLLSTTGAIAVDALQASLPTSCSVLPVTLVDFSANAVNDKTELVWTTTNETLVNEYLIERSADGRSFTTLARVSALNAGSLKTYRWSDQTTLPGRNYYRLKILDLDGKIKYSAIVRTDRHAKKAILIYPNPITGSKMQIQMTDQEKGNYSLNIFNLNAEKVSTQIISHNGHDAAVSVTLNETFVKGIYLLEITDPRKKRQVLKMIVE